MLSLRLYRNVDLFLLNSPSGASRIILISRKDIFQSTVWSHHPLIPLLLTWFFLALSYIPIKRKFLSSWHWRLLQILWSEHPPYCKNICHPVTAILLNKTLYLSLDFFYLHYQSAKFGKYYLFLKKYSMKKVSLSVN